MDTPITATPITVWLVDITDDERVDQLLFPRGAPIPSEGDVVEWLRERGSPALRCQVIRRQWELGRDMPLVVRLLLRPE